MKQRKARKKKHNIDHIMFLTRIRSIKRALDSLDQQIASGVYINSFISKNCVYQGFQ